MFWGPLPPKIFGGSLRYPPAGAVWSAGQTAGDRNQGPEGTHRRSRGQASRKAGRRAGGTEDLYYPRTVHEERFRGCWQRTSVVQWTPWDPSLQGIWGQTMGASGPLFPGRVGRAVDALWPWFAMHFGQIAVGRRPQSARHVGRARGAPRLQLARHVGRAMGAQGLQVNKARW